MKFFSWMQNRLGGKQDPKNPTTHSSTYHANQESREEFSDWPHGLLTIGTFGNKTELTKANPPRRHYNVEEEEPSSTAEEIVDFTPEEVGKLQKELTKLLRKKPNVERDISDQLPLDRFLNCPSSLEVDRRTGNNSLCTQSVDKEEDIEKTISVILGKCRDISPDNKNKAIGKKSLSFLLKKMFLCRSGFAQVPSLRDSLQESNMEKILRTILNKKINTQTAHRASMRKKYLEDKETQKTNEDEPEGKTDDGSKWVKTDSEYIVLEI